MADQSCLVISCDWHCKRTSHTVISNDINHSLSHQVYHHYSGVCQRLHHIQLNKSTPRDAERDETSTNQEPVAAKDMQRCFGTVCSARGALANEIQLQVRCHWSEFNMAERLRVQGCDGAHWDTLLEVLRNTQSLRRVYESNERQPPAKHHARHCTC